MFYRPIGEWEEEREEGEEEEEGEERRVDQQ